MPQYDYKCKKCKKRSSIQLSYAEYDTAHPSCRHCGSSDLQRLISRIRIMKSEDSRLDNLADPSSFGDLDENDPKSVGRFMRKMSSEMGEDLGPEFDEVVGRLESGEDPESIEAEMPDMGMGTAGTGGDDFGDLD